jgi:glycosyltransferase involved in cell wall biosynthesis
MKILIWCPYISLGGGLRLLKQLAPAVARNPEVEFVRLAIPTGSVQKAEEVFQGIDVFELSEKRDSGALRSWLESEGRVFGVRGTGRLKASLSYRLFQTQEPMAWQHEQLHHSARGCDVIYCFWPHRHDFPQTDKPVVCTYQDTTLIDYPELLGGFEAKKLKELSVGWVENSTMVVSSAATKQNLIRLFGEKCKAARVIHHAILPESDGLPSRRRSPLVEKFKGGYIIFPSHPSSTKNHHILLEAWARFERRKKFPLVFVGPATEKLNYEAHEKTIAYDWPILRLVGQIARYQLKAGEDFHALGYVDDEEIVPLVSGAKALIMPTLAEGGGSYPVEEALAAGTPVLCSDIPVMQEHLRGRTAKIGWFDPYSADAILSSLNDLFDNYDVYKQSAVQGISDPRPTWDDVAAQYVDVFRRVAGN